MKGRYEAEGGVGEERRRRRWWWWGPLKRDRRKIWSEHALYPVSLPSAVLSAAVSYWLFNAFSRRSHWCNGGCGVDNVPPLFIAGNQWEKTHNKHRDGANAVRAASQSSESTSNWRCAPYAGHYGELAPSPFHFIPHTGSSDVCLRVLLLFSPVAEELLRCIAWIKVVIRQRESTLLQVQFLLEDKHGWYWPADESWPLSPKDILTCYRRKKHEWWRIIQLIPFCQAVLANKTPDRVIRASSFLPPVSTFTVMCRPRST